MAIAIANGFVGSGSSFALGASGVLGLSSSAVVDDDDADSRVWIRSWIPGEILPLDGCRLPSLFQEPLLEPGRDSDVGVDACWRLVWVAGLASKRRLTSFAGDLYRVTGSGSIPCCLLLFGFSFADGVFLFIRPEWCAASLGFLELKKG